MSESSSPIGILGWVNQREGWALSFEGLEIQRFVDSHTLKLEFGRLVSRVLQLNDYRKSARDLESGVGALRRTEPDLNQVCGGHDVMSFLAVGLRRVLGSQRARDCRVEILEAGLRLAFHAEDMKRTNLYTACKEWEKRNVPFQIFSF